LTDLACNLTDCQGLLHIAANVFKIPEAARVTLLATNSRVKRPEPTVRAPRAAASVASAGSARSRVAATPSRRAAYQVAPPPAGRDAHGAAKHPAAAPSNPNGRAVRVASLKKR
jgi:hypothetical protein